MIRFILKGLIRDRQRSFLPIIVVVTGVFLTVFLQCWMTGILGDMIDFNARFTTGHVKVMTKAYSERIDQTPNDLALTETTKLVESLQKQFPDMEWIRRVRFGGLIDAPDAIGETRSQGPAIGWGIDLLSPESDESARMNIATSIVKGKFPSQPREVLISDQFADKLKVGPGDRVTLVGSTMYGSMTVFNFVVAGTVNFGSGILDRGSVIADINDVQLALDMPDAASEILGYFKTNLYNKNQAAANVTRFMSSSDKANRYAPVMISLRDQNGLASMVDYMDIVSAIFIMIFVTAMSLVLWNAGLLGGLRRYGEFGVRLAVGESKGHVYRSLVWESVLIGLIGSVIGTALGLLLSFWLQKKGIDVSGFMKNASMMLPAIFRAQVTVESFYIGFIPGLFATVIGTALAGLGIYKRKTAQLFKELE
jgi:putative ABC transport system permease protein